MNQLKTLGDYFESRKKSSSYSFDNVDLNQHFMAQSVALEQVYNSFTKIWLSADKGTAKGRATTIPVPVISETGLSLIPIFDAIFKDGLSYFPEMGGVDLALCHTFCLIAFYEMVDPEDVSIRDILVLDTASLKLASLLGAWSGATPALLKKYDHKTAVQNGAKKRSENNKKEVLKAWNDSGASWNNSGQRRAIVVNGKSMTKNLFVREEIIKGLGVQLDQKTIIFHLNALHDEGSI